MYEHRPPAPTYRILPVDPTGYRIFRRELDGWRSAYVHTWEDVDRILNWLEGV